MVVSSSLLPSALALSAVGTTNLTALFRPGLSPGAEIILPGDSNWASEVQARWTDYQAPTYLGAIKPATEEDIQNIVKVAQLHGIPFLATGGGHSFSDYSDFEGISIDLGYFNSTEFDESKTHLTVGGGAKYSQLYDLLYDAGKELPLGSCACPGVVGSTLGAGLGPLMGYRGLMIDALESVRLVTADGKIITASQSQNSELFWALRGAGTNFGIVTSASVKVYDITNNGQAMVAQMVFPPSSNSSYWRVLQSFDDYLPSRLALTNLAYYDRDTNQSLIALNAIYFGPQEEGEAYLKPFEKLGPINITVQMGPQNLLFPPILGSCDPNQHINIYSVALTHTDPKTLDSVYHDFLDFWQRYSGYQGRLLIQRFPNDAVVEVPDNETAYPWRNAITYVSIEGYMTDTSIYGVVDEFERSLRDRLAKTSGYAKLATYSNYARGNENPTSWYSQWKLPKLSALKKEWDPKELFSFNKPVPIYR